MLFEKKRTIIRNKINEYNYNQLKDFSANDIELIANLGYIDNVTIDFDNPIQENPTEGKMKVYNHFNFGNIEPEYYTVDSIRIQIKLEILEGLDIVCGYHGNTHSILLSANNENYDLSKDANDKHFLTFNLDFQLSEIKKMTSDAIRDTVHKRIKDYTYGTEFYYYQIKDEIDQFNKSLVATTKRYIDEKINKDSVLDMFSKAIGLEISPKNESRDKGKKITIYPKKLSTELPEKKTYEGYYFDKTNYDVILQTIREHLIATEILPKAIQKLSNEELIRDTILWALNANYIIATGETFRASGKTDINVNIDNKSAFIAECKVWNGQNTFSKALNQIYGYTTWRECRLAILIFNLDRQNFNEVISKLDSDIKNNQNYLSARKVSSTEWECKYKHPAKENDTITINVIIADYCKRGG